MATKLTAPQRDLLERVAWSVYGELWMKGRDLRVARALAARGLLELRGSGTRDYGITDAGHQALKVEAFDHTRVPPGTSGR